MAGNGDPGNPYAPSHSVAVEAGGVDTGPWPVRVAAVAAALLSGLPLMGAALFIVGRRRRALLWLALGLTVIVTMILASRLGLGKLYLGSMALAVAAYVTVIWQTARARPPYPMTTGRAVAWAVIAVVLAQVTVRVARRFGTEAFQIPSAAMMPTLLPGDHIAVLKGATAERGEMIVFRYPADPRVDYVKRVIAVGGDTVAVEKDVVLVNGRALTRQREIAACPTGSAGGCTVDEERVSDDAGARSYRVMHELSPMTMAARVVPPGHLFVMGDNRHNTSDSRVWGFVPAAHVKGRVRMVWWSRGEEGVRWDRVGIKVD